VKLEDMTVLELVNSVKGLLTAFGGERAGKPRQMLAIQFVSSPRPDDICECI
jgi:hypothetical protein